MSRSDPLGPSVRVLAVLGALLCLFLTPIHSYVWNGAESPAWILAAQPLLEGATGLAPIEPYDFFGRMFFMVYLAILPLCVGINRYRKYASGRLEQIGRWLTIGALTAGALGDFGAYWGSLGQEVPGFTRLQRASYGVEAAAILVLFVGAALFGIGILRARLRPSWAGWMLMGAMPAGIPVALIVKYAPHGLILPFSLAWGIVAVTPGPTEGLRAWTGQPEQDRS